MSAQIKLPDDKSVASMLEGMTGAEVDVGPCQAEPVPDQTTMIGVYVLDDGSAAALSFFSLPPAVAVSAALGMVPQPELEEIKAMDSIPEHLLENLHELMNVFAQLMNSDSSPHIRLSGLQALDALTDESAEIANQPARRSDFSVDVAGRSGTLTFAAKSC